STALVADAFHSFADVVGSTGIVVATKVSARAPDADYPYGRGKAEFIGAIFVYTVLLFFAAAIVISSIRSMLGDDLESPHLMTLLGAVVSVFHNLLMFRYLTCVGKRNNSPAILADAFENRADAISSVACIGGILGAMLLHPICDPIAALLVGVVIFWNCQAQLREAGSGLLDRSMDLDDIDRIRCAVLEDERVQEVRFLRTRQTGARFWIEVGIGVAADLSIADADTLALRLRRRIERSPQCHFAQIYVLPARSAQSEAEAQPEEAAQPEAEAQPEEAAQPEAEPEPLGDGGRPDDVGAERAALEEGLDEDV
ncbi:MAG: cation diffusion facilitator family transporter, partial [Myxococcales bacterium]|nr:cation diffusion facilitator family transporter [Myxococcales bacterium]